MNKNVVLLLIVSSVVFNGCSTTESRFSNALTVEPPCPVCDTGFITQAEWSHYNAPQPMVSISVAGNADSGNSEVETTSDCPVCGTGFITEAEWNAYKALNQTAATSSKAESVNTNASATGCCCECQAKAAMNEGFQHHITYVY